MLEKILIAIGLILAVATVALGQPVPGNDDAERIGIEWEHEEEAGTYRHHFQNLLWIQGGRSSEDRIGVTIQGPILSRFTIGGAWGVTKRFDMAEETREISGRDYDSNGTYWRVGIWFNFDKD